MNLSQRKLTPYQKAEVWSEIGLLGSRIEENNKKHQNSAELYKAIDRLLELQKMLKWHEVACSVGE